MIYRAARGSVKKVALVALTLCEVVYIDIGEVGGAVGSG